MRIQLDHSQLLARRGGQPDRIRREAVQVQVSRLAAVQEELDSAAEQGLLDHRRVVLDAEAVDRGQDWANVGEHLVLLGDPGTVCGATLLCGRDAVSAITSPDAAAVRRILSGGDKVHLVVLDGPPWVQSLARGLQGSVRRTTVVQGDGTLLVPLEQSAGIDSWVEPGAGDLRFAPFSPLAQALAEAKDVPLGPVMEAWRDAAERCAGRATWDNPGLLWAALAGAAASVGRNRMVLVSGGGLGQWSHWAQACWSAITVKAADSGSVRRADETLPSVGQVGDEALMQRLVEGPDDAWSVVATTSPGADDLRLASGAGSVGVLSRQLESAWTDLLSETRRPHIRLKLGGDGAPAALALATITVHAALALAVHRGLAPLQMPAADRLRALQRRWMDEDRAAAAHQE